MSMGKHDNTDYRNQSRVKIATDATVLGPDDTVVSITPGGTNTVILPHVSECAGKIFTFIQTDATAGTTTVRAAGFDGTTGSEDPNWTALTFTAIQDRAVIVCDGRRWITLLDETT